MIVIAHYAFWCATTPMDQMPPQIVQWTNLSAIGMPIFFTLSGFVIALSYSHWDWRRRPIFNLVRLFFYRFARLYPAFLVFAVLIVMRYPPLRDLSDPAVRDYLWPHLLLWHTWWPTKFDGALAIEDQFHVSWSLSTECALYLMFGLGAVLAATINHRGRRVALGALCFVAIWVLIDLGWLFRDRLEPVGWDEWDWGRWLFHLSPLAVALQFAIGAAAYQFTRGPLPTSFLKLASEIGGAGLVIIYLLVALGVSFSPPLFVSAATALLMVGAPSDSLPNRLLSGRAIVFIGTISYSLYLFHFLFPGMAFTGQLPVFDRLAVAYYLANIVASLAVAVFLATGIYRLVEVPGRRAIRSMADRLLGVERRPAVAAGDAPAE